MSEDDDSRPGAAAEASRLPRFSLGVRVLLWIAGLLLVAVGIAGLVLPGIQGVLTIAAGVAVLSLASEAAHRLLRRALARWPKLAERVDRWRERFAGWVARRSGERVDK